MTAAPDGRLFEVVGRLTKALHEQVVELQITETELRAALAFLTEVGSKDEFIILSDVLGVSVLVDEITSPTEGRRAVRPPRASKDRSIGRTLRICRRRTRWPRSTNPEKCSS